MFLTFLYISIFHIDADSSSHAAVYITLNCLWADSADDKYWWYFSYFSQKTGFNVMQIVSLGDNLHDMLNPVFYRKQKNISKCHPLKLLPSKLSNTR